MLSVKDCASPGASGCSHLVHFEPGNLHLMDVWSLPQFKSDLTLQFQEERQPALHFRWIQFKRQRKALHDRSFHMPGTMPRQRVTFHLSARWILLACVFCFSTLRIFSFSQLECLLNSSMHLTSLIFDQTLSLLKLRLVFNMSSNQCDTPPAQGAQACTADPPPLPLSVNQVLPSAFSREASKQSNFLKLAVVPRKAALLHLPRCLMSIFKLSFHP